MSRLYTLALPAPVCSSQLVPKFIRHMIYPVILSSKNIFNRVSNLYQRMASRYRCSVALDFPDNHCIKMITPICLRLPDRSWRQSLKPSYLDLSAGKHPQKKLEIHESCTLTASASIVFVSEMICSNMPITCWRLSFSQGADPEKNTLAES